MIRLNDAFSDGPVAEIPPQVLEEAVSGIFAPGGLLQKNLGLDHRPQQESMALKTLEALLTDAPLFFEAGTGVGKSLAYLVPGLIRAVSSERPFVVSTHTIALQEQIEKKDLPICRKLFSSTPDLRAYADFRHAILLGRANYLCGSRLAQSLKARTELFPSAEQKELERIAEWAQTTKTGLCHELQPGPLPDVWEWVHADGHACNSRNCSPKTCFFRKAREAVRQSNLVIVNHSLLFALLAAGHFPQGNTPGILFPNDFMTLDEAHTLPSVATDYFGLQLSAFGLKQQFQKLYQPGAKKARGLLLRHGNPGLRQQVLELEALADAFFNSIREEFLLGGQPFRLRSPNWTENTLNVPMRDLVHGLAKCESRLEEGPARDELEGVRQRLQGYREGIAEAIQLADPEAVYWLEPAGRKQHLVHLKSAPLDVAEPLKRRLFTRNTGLVLTSATLAEGPEMHSFKKKVGAPEAAHIQAASPFDYTMQMEILIHQGMPVPSSEDGRLDTASLAAEILRLGLEVEGGSLVLFTSYRDLNAVASLMQQPCLEEDRPLLCQGQGISRAQLLQQFKQSGQAFLLGTDSFWTGVDVPGPALSQVIVTRLPFENPSHPIAEARAERCREAGGSPFAELVLPAALVKFRQGIGRLIRNHSDEGRLVIMDSRILSKRYGSLFLDVLPHDHIRRIG